MLPENARSLPTLLVATAESWLRGEADAEAVRDFCEKASKSEEELRRERDQRERESKGWYASELFALVLSAGRAPLSAALAKTDAEAVATLAAARQCRARAVSCAEVLRTPAPVQPPPKSKAAAGVVAGAVAGGLWGGPVGAAVGAVVGGIAGSKVKSREAGAAKKAEKGRVEAQRKAEEERRAQAEREAAVARMARARAEAEAKESKTEDQKKKESEGTEKRIDEWMARERRADNPGPLSGGILMVFGSAVVLVLLILGLAALTSSSSQQPRSSAPYDKAIADAIEATKRERAAGMRSRVPGTTRVDYVGGCPLSSVEIADPHFHWCLVVEVHNDTPSDLASIAFGVELQPLNSTASYPLTPNGATPGTAFLADGIPANTSKRFVLRGTTPIKLGKIRSPRIIGF